MFDFLKTAAGIRVFYGRTKGELTEDDFWPLTKEQYNKLPKEERTGKWFMINPSKLKSQSEEI